jgi:LAGLIDADG DNA endonuclease family protein
MVNNKVQDLKLSNLQEDLIVGTLLGNSRMHRLDIFDSIYIIISFNNEGKDELYLNFLYLIMKNLTPFSSVKEFYEVDKTWQYKNKNLKEIFYSWPLLQLLPIFNQFYIKRGNNYLKTVPYNIEEIINPQKLGF